MISVITRVDFSTPPGTGRAARAVVVREMGWPTRLAQTQHPMAEAVQELMRRIRIQEGITFPARNLGLEELRMLERVIAPYAEVGTAFPADSFPRQLWGSIHATSPEGRRFTRVAEILAAWSEGDPRAAMDLSCRIRGELTAQWVRKFSGKQPPASLEGWALQIACLLARPCDIRRLDLPIVEVHQPTAQFAPPRTCAIR